MTLCGLGYLPKMGQDDATCDAQNATAAYSFLNLAATVAQPISNINDRRITDVRCLPGADRDIRILSNDPGGVYM